MSLGAARRARGLIAVLTAAAGCSGDPPPAARAATPSVIEPEEGVLRLAGSGAMVPLLRAEAQAFAARGAALRVIVEESIGSSGGIQAAFDGAVDVGMVARALLQGERGLALREVAVGRDAVVIAAHPDAAIASLTREELRALVAGEQRTFPDGSPAVVLLRDAGESANVALDAAVPGFQAARARAYQSARSRVLYHDSAMAEALASTPGSIGMSSLGVLTSARSRLKILELDGRRPSLASLADGSWPAARSLSLVMRPERFERARPLLDFLRSEDGARIARAGGYLPMPTGASLDGGPR